MIHMDLHHSIMTKSDGQAQPSGSIKTTKRRFAGPAGLLPFLKGNDIAQLDSPKRSKNSISEKIDNIISSETRQNSINIPVTQFNSQNDQSFFQTSTWRTILSQLELDSEDDPDSPMNLMNINWIRTKAMKNPTRRKIPFLIGMLQETNDLIGTIGTFSKNGNPHVTLVDPTGSIEVAVDPDFLAAYGDELISGTAIALKNIGVLQFKRAVILTITESNVICMTSRIDRNSLQKSNPSHKVFLTKDDVRVSHFCDFRPDQMIKDFHLMNLPDETELIDDEDEGNEEIENLKNQSNLFTETSTNYKNTNSRKPSLLQQTRVNENMRRNFAFQSKTNPKPLDRSFTNFKTPTNQFSSKQQVIHNTLEKKKIDVDPTFDDEDEFLRLMESIQEYSQVSSIKIPDIQNNTNSSSNPNLSMSLPPPISNTTEGEMPCDDNDDEFFQFEECFVSPSTQVRPTTPTLDVNINKLPYGDVSSENENDHEILNMSETECCSIVEEIQMDVTELTEKQKVGYTSQEKKFISVTQNRQNDLSLSFEDDDEFLNMLDRIDD